MRDNDDSLTIQLPNGKCESISLSFFTCHGLCWVVAIETRSKESEKEHLQNIKLSMKFICFCRHSHKIVHIIWIIGLNVAASVCALASLFNWLESVWKHLPTCICIQQLIGSSLYKCCHVVINLSCPTVVQRRYRLLHSEGNRQQAFYWLSSNKPINILRHYIISIVENSQWRLIETFWATQIFACIWISGIINDY